MSRKPRLYLHLDGETISIGFDNTQDTLLFLKKGDNWKGKIVLEDWVESVNKRLVNLLES